MEETQGLAPNLLPMEEGRQKSMKKPPLFVVFSGYRKRIAQPSRWVVVTKDVTLDSGPAIDRLGAELEQMFEYDEGSVYIMNFERLELAIDKRKDVVTKVLSVILGIVFFAGLLTMIALQ
jgi:hypothetical protein